MANIALVVEEVLPTDKITPMNLRVLQYLRAGVKTVCLLHPEESAMTVYRSGRGLDFYEADEEVPELRCCVAEFFAEPGHSRPIGPRKSGE
jgi:hypothetical protein